MSALGGHFWTLAGRMRQSRVAEPLPAESWAGWVDDPKRGRVPLSGIFHQTSGAKRFALLVHGLGGSAESPYLRAAAAAAVGDGWACLRLNLRGSDRRGDDFYHAGLIEDLAAALASPEASEYERAAVLGFSLGGHLALRLACLAPPERLVAVAAVCPPLDLAATGAALDAPAAKPYRVYLLRHLRALYRQVAAHQHLALPAEALDDVTTLRRWDDLVVAPRFGFADAGDYYRQMSVGPVLGRLERPALVVAALDDPMVPAATVRPSLAGAPGCLTVRWASRGGHVGFPPGLDLGLDPRRRTGLERQVLGWLGGVVPP